MKKNNIVKESKDFEKAIKKDQKRINKVLSLSKQKYLITSFFMIKYYL